MPGAEAGPGERRRFGSRPILTLMGAALALLVTAGAASFVVAPKWATALALRAVLAVSGFSDAQFTVEEARFRKLALAEVTFGDALTARRLETSFGRFGPFGGLHALKADGLRVAATLNAKGLSFGALDRLLLTSGTGAGALPGFSIALEDAAFKLDTPFGRAEASARAVSIDPKKGGTVEAALFVEPRAGARLGLAPHSGTLLLVLSPAGALDLNLTLKEKSEDSRAAQLLRLSGAKLSLRNFTATNGAWQGRVALETMLDGPLGPSLRFDKGALTSKGRIEQRKGRLAIFGDGCAEARNMSLALTTFTATSPALSLCPQQADKALLVQESDALALAASVPSAKITLTSASGDLVTGMLPALGLDLSTRAAQWRAALTAQGGMLTAPTPALSLSLLDASGEIEGEGDRIGEGTLALKHGKIADITRAPRIAALALSGKVDVAGESVSFRLDAAAEGAGRFAQLNGEHDFKSGAGRSSLALERITFAPDALQPPMLLPLLRGLVTRASGAVDGTAELAWGEAGFRSEARLNLRALGFHAGFVEFAGVEGTVSLSDLFPLTTPAPQEIRVQMMDVGVPLEGGVLRFELAPDIDIRVREASFPFLAGKVFLEPFALGPGLESKITLAFEDIDLKALLELVAIKGLAGSGRIRARVPVLLEGERQVIAGAHAEALAPGGSLTYKNVKAAAEAKGKETEILFKALDDFRYTALTADLSGPLDGELSLKVHLKGNNPALYSGYPVELNVSTEGPFVSMLRRGLYAYRTPGSQ
jgi:hypothetical protein